MFKTFKTIINSCGNNFTYHSKPGKQFTPILKLDKNISPENVQKIFQSVGWKTRHFDDIKKSLEKSILVVTAWDKDSLVGIARATGDGIFTATVWDLAVHPEYQRLGVGSRIINCMLTKLDAYGIPLVTLYTDCSNKDFYTKLGFGTQFNKIISMFRYRKQ
ncbi:MAG: GNAT family N-acetyltransferase [bacterium]